MNQNNAAQAAAQILTYLGFAQAVSMEPAADPRRGHIQALIESALLSKLRAPVVDERAVRIPVPFSVDTTHKNQAFVTLGFYDEALRKEFVRAVCSGGFRVPTDALASAPVAGEAQLPWHVPVQHWTDEEKAKLVAAPQASEAECSCPSGNGSLRHPCAVHPASEAVRDALAELVRLQNLKDSKSHQPNPQRSDEWAEYRRLWPVAMDKARTALSAQPGAQRTGGSDDR